MSDIALIPMGAPDELDEQVFSTLVEVKDHGGDQWWLFVAKCNVCGEFWMIAQDERIHDNFYLRRLPTDVAKALIEDDVWPSDFMTYEQVLRMGVEAGNVAIFLDPLSPALIETARDLRRERPDITATEVGSLLSVSPRKAQKLLNR